MRNAVPRASRSQWAKQTSEPIQFVSDLREITTPRPGARWLTDLRAAADLMLDETRSRLRAVLRDHSGHPFILLSGGVDSIFVAAAAASINVRPHALTVETGDNTDGTRAAAAAYSLGLTHESIRLQPNEVVALAREAMVALRTSELWEVTAAIPFLAAARRLDSSVDVGAILTGTGADVILAGGKVLHHPIGSSYAVDELDTVVRDHSTRSFTHNRLVPHFRAATMGKYENRLINVFQTVRFFDVAETFAPQVLFTEFDGRIVDKLCLRIACDHLLESSAKQLAWSRKSELQRSSGVLASLATSARQHAADLPGATTYTDPAVEPFEAVTTRLYLALLDARGGRAERVRREQTPL